MTAALSRNLAPTYYVDPAIYARERAAIFRRHWHLLGPVDQVGEPGQYLAVALAEWQVFVLHGRDGRLRAFHNVCRHRGARLLADGGGRCATVCCPYHLWVYGDDGQLLQTPGFGADADLNRADWPLLPLALETWRGLLFVAIEPAMSLAAQLGDLPQEVAALPLESYRAVAEERFVMASNWKTYTDNFVEGYHLPGIHPAFARVIDVERFEADALTNAVRMTAPQRDGSIYGGTWLWGWPNWTLSVFPGGMNTSRINPLGVDRTELVYHFYFADVSPATEATRRRTIETNCAIVREDFGICEHTQRNYASGAYVPGPLSPRQERAVAYFQRKVLESL